MHDNAPIKFTLADTDKGERALILMFEDDFRLLSSAQQETAFSDYIQQLKKDLTALADTDPNKSGIAVIFQVCSELAPHIINGEVPLDRPITVELGQLGAAPAPSVPIIDLTQH